LSQENQSYLRFSVEESLWFRKGQEVEELISISLDPDITIQENDQYVTIRGSLELTGEYKNIQESPDGQAQEQPSQKFVERVAEQEEGVCEFSHRFPVDITIPNNRIQSVYDIDVLVDSFDYSLPERSCLKLSAELTISGLYETESQQEQEQEYEVVHRADPVNEEEEIEIEEPAAYSPFADNVLFEIEARKQQEEEPKAELLPKFPTFNYQPDVTEESGEGHPAWQFQEYQQEPGEPVLNFQDARSEKHHVEVETELEKKAEVVPEILEEAEEVLEQEESSSSSEEAPKKKIKAGKKKTMTLTEFFARKDESTQTATLRVCIVQKGDTIESLAERYSVTVHNLMRENQLEISQDVHEGQVLYIPAALAKK